MRLPAGYYWEWVYYSQSWAFISHAHWHPLYDFFFFYRVLTDHTTLRDLYGICVTSTLKLQDLFATSSWCILFNIAEILMQNLLKYIVCFQFALKKYFSLDATSYTHIGVKCSCIGILLAGGQWSYNEDGLSFNVSVIWVQGQVVAYTQDKSEVGWVNSVTKFTCKLKRCRYAEIHKCMLAHQPHSAWDFSRRVIRNVFLTLRGSWHKFTC